MGVWVGKHGGVALLLAGHAPPLPLSSILPPTGDGYVTLQQVQDALQGSTTCSTSGGGASTEALLPADASRSLRSLPVCYADFFEAALGLAVEDGNPEALRLFEGSMRQLGRVRVDRQLARARVGIGAGNRAWDHASLRLRCTVLCCGAWGIRVGGRLGPGAAATRPPTQIAAAASPHPPCRCRRPAARWTARHWQRCCSARAQRSPRRAAALRRTVAGWRTAAAWRTAALRQPAATHLPTMARPRGRSPRLRRPCAARGSPPLRQRRRIDLEAAPGTKRRQLSLT
jgi:hypothetical protein